MKNNRKKTDTTATVELPEFFQTEKQNATGKRINSDKEHIPLTQRTAAKVTAFILAIIMLMLSAASVFAAMLMHGEQMYRIPKEQFIQDRYSSIAYTDIDKIVRYIDMDIGGQSSPESYCENRNIYSVELTEKDSNKIIWSYRKNSESETSNVGEGIMTFECEYSYYPTEKVNGAYIFDDQVFLDAKIEVYEKPVADDSYMLAYNVINLIYDLLYWIYGIIALAVICTVVCGVFLICASGHRKGYEKVQPGWGTKIPFDLVTAVVVLFITGIISFFLALYISDVVRIIIFLSIIGVLSASAILGWVMSFALRIKLGKWWKNTIIFRVLSLIWRGVSALFGLLGNIHLVWKTALIVVGISIAEMIAMFCVWNSYGNMFALWFFSSIILGLLVIYCAVKFKKLQGCAKALANGDLYHQIDTDRLRGEFKKHGEALNSIAVGMTIAVEERMKSERMKTELITNVSHDIKTPLTSIINYTDLISREPCDNEKIYEYSEVLLRQSERLKRLIEDLVEASKASTGNLEVLLAPCEANILLTQAVGEYEEKLRSKELELITNQPDKPIMIMADGRRLWRVFDNLINNIYKYAQSSTRVYLSLEEKGGEAVITFKNTSHAPLNLSAEELMERFVRGDSSRNTEGNGLGLSIARSLTELQNGSLEISIDGDLFKVTLRFPVIK